ncbi:MAG: hypothetical protein E6J01_15900 [Chloroflexi bacterium]|nr:MAG: hypothetical protein E6J01_15900 [Chloroflexota bacterium]
MLSARLLCRDPLNGPLRIEFALEFCPDDGHCQKGSTIWGRCVDLLRDANEVNVLFLDVFQEGEVVSLVAREAGEAMNDDRVELFQAPS